MRAPAGTRARHGHGRIDHEHLIWGVECTLAVVIGAGGPVKRSKIDHEHLIRPSHHSRENSTLPPTLYGRRYCRVSSPGGTVAARRVAAVNAPPPNRGRGRGNLRDLRGLHPPPRRVHFWGAFGCVGYGGLTRGGGGL
eukprot:561908-Pyramimonas_sp.AAC.1